MHWAEMTIGISSPVALSGVGLTGSYHVTDDNTEVYDT